MNAAPIMGNPQQLRSAFTCSHRVRAVGARGRPTAKTPTSRSKHTEDPNTLNRKGRAGRPWADSGGKISRSDARIAPSLALCQRGRGAICDCWRRVLAPSNSVDPRATDQPPGTRAQSNDGRHGIGTFSSAREFRTCRRNPELSVLTVERNQHQSACLADAGWKQRGCEE